MKTDDLEIPQFDKNLIKSQNIFLEMRSTITKQKIIE